MQFNLTQERKAAIILWILCISIVSFRIWYSESITYRFLLWNLFLATLPLLFSEWVEKSRRTWQVIVGICCWLLFFPNAPYILTDFIHLRPMQNIPVWYDLVLLFLFALSGLVLGFLSLMKIRRRLRQTFHPVLCEIMVFGFLFLASFGVYLGRFQRWNSWNILSDPGILARDIADRFLNPVIHPRTWAVTFLFSFVLFGLYQLILLLYIENKKVKPVE